MDYYLTPSEQPGGPPGGSDMRHVRRFERRVGARGAMLLTLSGLWLWLFALPLIISEPRQVDVMYQSLPAWARLSAWLFTIGLAVIAAFVPPRKDWFGWAALTVMPAERCFAWLWAWFEHEATAGTGGESGGWYQAVLYALIIVVVWVAAAMRPAVMESSEVDDTWRSA